MRKPRSCSSCGQALPESAPEGLCPRCLMAGALQPTEPARCEAPDLESVRAAFPQIEVLSLVGQGGMGVVFRARQPQLDRCVALKILAPGRTEDPRFAERFQREAKALARLSHPNIVTIHDFGIARMLGVEGGAPAGATAAEGAAAPAAEADRISGEAKPATDTGSFTAAAVAGTPRYMAPEQREHPRQADHRAVFDKPSFLNPDGWAVKAQMTLGGVARIELPGESGRRFEITLVEGNDDSITVRIVDSARKTSMMLSLLRDRFGQVTVDGAGYRVVYLGVQVAPEASETSPFAHVVLTPAEEANRDTK